MILCTIAEGGAVTWMTKQGRLQRPITLPLFNSSDSTLQILLNSWSNCFISQLFPDKDLLQPAVLRSNIQSISLLLKVQGRITRDTRSYSCPRWHRSKSVPRSNKVSVISLRLKSWLIIAVELQAQYSNYKNTLQSLAQKAGDIEQEIEEHK